jgi:hypothetical protein
MPPRIDADHAESVAQMHCRADPVIGAKADAVEKQQWRTAAGIMRVESCPIAKLKDSTWRLDFKRG